jgi:hypothetical protein
MKKFPAAVLTSLMLAPTVSVASTPSCWVLTELRGQALYASDQFKPAEDGFSHTNPRITLIFNGQQSAATGDNIRLVQIGDYMAVGALDTADASITETYSVDPATRRAFYTKSAFMHSSLFAPMTGTKAFVGNAIPCK